MHWNKGSTFAQNLIKKRIRDCKSSGFRDYIINLYLYKKIFLKGSCLFF